MAGEITPSLFVTANVGSIFEDPTSMLKTWTEEFLATVVRLEPKFVALHCQEVGGKKYEASMKHVEEFVKLLLTSEELRLFDKAQIYLDEDFSSTESFTALGNFYLIHESVTDVLVFDFEDMCFVPVDGRNVHSGNIEHVTTKEKSKFPQELFPECKWARKGFMRTRWKLNGTVFDLINIHLFHDASNFVAMESFPSIYCQNRQRALDHTLKRFHTDRYGGVPYIVFGDFNFRTDTQGVVKVILTLGKKEFSHLDHQKTFTENVSDWLKNLDREYEPFQEELFEFPISFPPTYPYVEDNNGGECYMQTRCPSWCDRVFLSCSAKSLVNNIEDESGVEYGLIGKNSCMGDHKPVYLRAEIIGGQGTVSGTTLLVTSHLSIAKPPCLYAINRLPPSPPSSPPGSPLTTLSHFNDNMSTTIQQDGLTVPVFQHHNSPYTPDSTDTEPESLSTERVSPQELATSLEQTASERKKSSTSSATRELRRNSNSRRSGSKIPVRETNPPATPVSPPSRIPVAKSKRKSQEKTDGSSRRTLPDIQVEKVEVKDPPRLVLEVDRVCSDEENSESAGESPLGDISFMDTLAPTRIRGSESDSVTDSGFSVSPALSGAMSPSMDTDCSVKSCTAMDAKPEEIEEDVIEVVTPSVTMERFSLVRRIQSASSMERKSSFPPVHSENLSDSNINNGMRTYRCFSDSSWKERPPGSHGVLTQSQSRIRLISSSSNLDQTLPRLQSHHSSSEEEWFEEVEEKKVEESRPCLVRQKRLSTHAEDESSVGNGGEHTSEEVEKTVPKYEVAEVNEQASPLRGSHKTLSRDGAIDDKVAAQRRYSASSDGKKSQKKSKCKACCSVM